MPSADATVNGTAHQTADPPCLLAALDYLARGWSPLLLCPPDEADHTTLGPAHQKLCTSRGKQPIGGWKQYQEKPATEKELRARWQQYPAANVGVALGPVSQLVGLDIDGEAGEKLLDKISGGDDPDTLEFTTPGGGRRLLFTLPENVQLPTTKLHGKGKHEELRLLSAGSLTVMPPSKHANGGTYAWKPHCSPDDRPAQIVPQWLVKWAQQKNKAQTKPGNGPASDGQPIPEGQRNTRLTSIAGALRRHGATEQEILAALLTINHRCQPPLTDTELAKIANSIAKYEPQPASVQAEPQCRPEAYYGLAGDIVKRIKPHTEADPVALLVQLLVMFGCCIGRKAHFLVEATKHSLNLFAVLVGKTAKARKGTSFDRCLEQLTACDPTWASNCILNGLSTGEGLIWAVRDATKNKKGKEVPGVKDKRLLCYEPELASILKKMERENNTLSSLLRQAWDRGDLRNANKNSPDRATGAHIALIAHTTVEELVRYLTATEQANGWANRIAWFYVKRCGRLPLGGSLAANDLKDLTQRLAKAVAFATRQTKPMAFDQEAKSYWIAHYEVLSADTPGLLGAMTARAEAQVRRLACLYALLDHSKLVRLAHLKAALTLWDYSAASVDYLFGHSLGDPTADTIRQQLQGQPDGLTRTQINNLFSGHKKAADIDRALQLLQKNGLAHKQKTDTAGHPEERWFYGPGPAEKEEKEEKGPAS